MAKSSDVRGSILLALFGVTVVAAPEANKIRQTEVTTEAKLKNFPQMEAILLFLWNNLVCDIRVRQGENLRPSNIPPQYKIILEMN